MCPAPPPPPRGAKVGPAQPNSFAALLVEEGENPNPGPKLKRDLGPLGGGLGTLNPFESSAFWVAWIADSGQAINAFAALSKERQRSGEHLLHSLIGEPTVVFLHSLSIEPDVIPKKLRNFLLLTITPPWRAYRWGSRFHQSRCG
jgi:hypothetical protein